MTYSEEYIVLNLKLYIPYETLFLRCWKQYLNFSSCVIEIFVTNATKDSMIFMMYLVFLIKENGIYLYIYCYAYL